MGKNVLFIAPHPDDEILGCGGIIKKFSDQGDTVIVLIMTRGKKELYSEERILNVRKEALSAHQILGVKQTIFFEFPAPDLDTIPMSELSSSVSEILRDYGINSLYLPHGGDIHQDHKAVFRAGLIAARPAGPVLVKEIFSYETLSETEWSDPGYGNPFITNVFVNIGYELAYKKEAMSCYKSQLREFPSSRSLKSIEALANLRGSTVGVEYAEAFMAIRIIKD
jgi:LmbE family N-acetylglucosaminyl deacetylase